MPLARGLLFVAVAALLTGPSRGLAQCPPEAVGCHISLDVEAEDGLTIVGWPPSLRESLTNLVFNAVDALPGGGVIRLAARHAAGMLLIRLELGGMPEASERQVSCSVVTQVGSSGPVAMGAVTDLPSWVTSIVPVMSRGSQKPTNPLS